MAIPPIKETFRDRLLTDEEAAGLPNILNLDPDVNVRRGDYQSLSDAYNYYLGGGLDAIAPVPPSEVDTTGVQTLDTSGLNQGTSGENTGITATGVTTPIAPTVEQTAAMEDIGAIPSIVQDPMTGDVRIAEDIAAQDRQEANITPEAQNAWQKVQSGLASTGDFIRDFGPEIYQFFQGNITAGLAGLATGPIGLGLTAATSAFQTTPEQKAMQSAAQAAGIIDPNNPTKDIYGKNIVSAFGDYDQSVADSIATLEESGANPEKLAALKNYQNEKAKTDTATITTRDEAIGAGIAAADDDSGADMFEETTDMGGFITKEEYDKATAGMETGVAEIPTMMQEYYSKPIGERIAETTGYNVNDIALAAMEEDAELGDYATPENINKAVNALARVAGAVALGTPLTLKAITAQLVKQKAAGDVLGKTLGTVYTKQVEGQKQDFKEEQEQREFAETGDYDVFSDTPTSGPTVDIADIGAEDEEDYSAPTGGGGTDVSGPSESTSASSASTSDGGFGDTPGPRGGGQDASGPSTGRGRTDAESQYGGTSYSAPSKGGGGGGGGGGGKSIVCTAMYQTTGLEDWSKAMKIWYIYQQKYLTEEHQKGYHKLFKPFVKAMYKNKFIKAIGAHVAKHRTQDLKSIMFGSKSSLLGRIYRKILEPICYWVGKNG